jgi:sulfite reductase (ferredoxin)
VPSKRGPDVLRYLLNDYIANAQTEESFLKYTERRAKIFL